MRVTKPEMPRLQRLVSFLNYDFGKKKWPRGSPFAAEYKWPVINAGERDAQRELMGDLAPLCDGQGDSGGAVKRLVAKINRLGIRAGWIPAMRGLRSGQKAFRVGGSNWFLTRYDTFSPKSAREALYWEIHLALLDGSFSRLGRCLWCKTFFVAKKAGGKFCKRGCHVKFWNKKHLEDKYVTNLRRKQRANRLRKARVLHQEAKSPAWIASETGLSLKILRKERVID